MQKLRGAIFAVPELLPGTVLLLCSLPDSCCKACPLSGTAEVQADSKREKIPLRSGAERESRSVRLDKWVLKEAS